MKITVFLLFCSFVSILASPGNAQATKISLNLKNATIEDVLNKIEDESDYNFLFNQKLVNINQKVDIEADNESIKEILNQILGPDIKYFVYDRQIILTPAKADNTAFEQQNVTTGTIKDTQTGEPMAGVTVLVKGTTIGTVSDGNGKYSLPAIQANATIIFSFVGYTTKEVSAAGKTIIDISLDSELKAIDEVVVIGYGTAKRSDLVSAVASVQTDEIKNQPAARVDEALAGRTAGISIQNTSAAPNGAFSIRIRGSNSLSGSNDPLVVVDGFIGGDLSQINPNEIANIEILKDASSTAIYGSRGANGVILVTTKKGTSDKAAVVEYNTYVNFLSISKKMNLLSAGQYAELVDINRVETAAVGAIPAKPFSDQQIADFYANGGTDWQNVVFRNALAQNHQLSVSGGTAKTNFYISGAYTNNEGIIIGSSFNSYSLRSNLETAIYKKLRTGINLFLVKSANHPVQTGGSQDSSPTQGALLWGAVKPVYQADGTYTQPGGGYGPPAVYNPLALAIEPIRDNFRANTEVNSFINYDIIKGLAFRVVLGARLVDDENNAYNNTKARNGAGSASASITARRSLILQNTNQLTYATRIANAHDINVVVAYEQQSELNNSSMASTQGFTSDELTYHNLGLGSLPQVPSSSIDKKVILSYVGRVNYSFKDKYLISISSRYDGASVFGNNKWGYFPSAALAWRVSNESFMKNITVISSLKLRASYGVTGNQGVSPYSSLAQLATNLAYNLNGVTVTPGVGISTIANPDLKWEKTGQTNFGVDLGLLKGRISFTADYYIKRTSDLLMSVPVPTASGYANILRNIGKTQNQGIELALGGSPFIGKYTWKTNINFAYNQNEVLQLSGPSEIPMGTTGFPNFGNTIYLVVGQPMGVLKGYIQDGCWGTAEAAAAATYGVFPGAPKYIDQNSDGKIDSKDIVIMGNTSPKYTYGWSNTFTSMGFDLNVMVQGSAGNKRYNQTRIRSERQSSDADATDARILNRWTPDNQNTSVPSFAGSLKEQIQSSRWMEDGSFTRFKNITLGYSIPKTILSKVNMTSLRFYVSGVNLFTFTKYTGYDPEAATNTGTLGGIDQAPYPSQKMYTVGLNVVF